MPHEKSQELEEFAEILEDFQRIESRKEGFFSALFVDHQPLWRQFRYKLLVKNLNIQTETLPKKAFNSFLHEIRRKELHEEALALFTKVEFKSFCKAIVHLMKRIGKAERGDDLFQTLQNTREAIQNTPNALRLPLFSTFCQFVRGQVNFRFDPYMQENTPYILFHYNNIPVIRMGTPTCEGYFAPITETAHITKEFELFLQSYKKRGLKHLYINLQNRVPQMLGKNEAPRCRALEALAEQYPDTFTLVTLTKNSSFYSQEGLFEHLDDAAKFKEQLLQQLFLEDSGFFFDQIPLLLESDQIFASLIQKVHTQIFAGKQILNQEERRAFIELFYLELEKYLIDLIKPNSLNISCKDGIDRAGAATSLLYFDTHLKGKKLTDEEVLDLEAILFAPALLVKKRPILENRFRRFMSAARYL